jgi:ATP-dependent Clp protease protease subunit
MTKDWIDALFEYGVDKNNRRIFLFDQLDNQPIGMVIKALYMMDSEKNDPIELFVGSYGGCEYDMFALYDALRTLKSPVHTTAIGKCMSAAPLLVCAGKENHRYATPNTYFMVHISWIDPGIKRTDELKIDLRHIEDTHKKWCVLMERHTKRDAAFWKAQCEKVGDRYFDAYTAQEWGIIDHVWDETEGK